MQSKSPLNPKLLSNWKQLRSETLSLEVEILNRIDYILHTWFEIFGAKLENWWFDGAEEGEVGDLDRAFGEHSISGFYVEAKNFPDNDMAFIDEDGDVYTWQSEIPTRWLFDDYFTVEIAKGKEEYEKREQERLAKKKQKAADKKNQDQKLAAEAKKKLSKEELAALRRTL